MEPLPPEIIEISLNEYREAYESGDKSQLISAIRFCGCWKVVMPDWLVKAFGQATNKWYNYEVKELGEALGLTWQGGHLNAARKKRFKKFAVYHRVKEKIAEGISIDKAFVEVGKQKDIGLGATLVSEYYYEVKELLSVDK